MATTHELNVMARQAQGQGASRRLRRAGYVPGIIYGGDKAPEMVQFDHNKIWLAQQNEWFYSSLIQLKLEGETQKVLLRDLQRHPYKQLILHLDFQRVNENEVLHTTVPLHFINEEISPAGKTASVLVTHELKEVHIACLPKDLPESIEVDLAELKAGDIIHLSSLKLPAGVEIPALKLGKEHDDAVVIAKSAGGDDSAAE